MDAFLRWIGRSLRDSLAWIGRFIRDEIFVAGFRYLVRNVYFWMIAVAVFLGYAQKHPGSQSAALANQLVAQGCQGVDALLPAAVVGALLFGGLGMINPFRRRGGRGHDRHGRGRH